MQQENNLPSQQIVGPHSEESLEERPKPSDRTSEDASESSESSSVVSSEGSEPLEGTLQDRYGRETKSSTRTDFHTITISEIHEALVKDGNPISARALTNWCHRNTDNTFLLDAYFDPAEKKYYITEESVRDALKKKHIDVPNEFSDGTKDPGIPENKSSDEQPIFSETESTDAESNSERISEPSDVVAEATSELNKVIPNNPVELASEVRRLRREKLQLAIDFQVQHRFVVSYEDQQKKVMEFVSEQGKEIGTLREQVRVLPQPQKDEESPSSQEPSEESSF